MDRVAQIVLERIGVIAPLLDEAMAGAILQAETRAFGLAHPRYPHLRPLTIRADLREALEAEPLPEGWRIDGDPRKMGQLILVDEVSGMRLRVLKAPYSQPDRVPHAGSNHARRAEWTQPPFSELATRSALLDDTHLAGQVFLLLWTYVDPEDRAAGYTLRVVHTLVPGAFGEATRCDLDLLIPRGGAVGEGDLAFAGSDADEDLFLFSLPDEADEEEGLA